MDGLIHGLIKVALGGGGRGEEEEEVDGNNIESSSRSTWAEVVSSGQDGNHQSSQWESRKEGRSDGDEWKTVDHHSSHLASRKDGKEEGKSSSLHSNQWASRKEDDEGKTDGDWETVGEKKKQHQSHPSRRQQKFYMEEAKGNVDYQGYIFPRRRGQCPDSETRLLTLQLEWNGVLKSLSSILVGVSPEFEIALYMLCFFVGGEDNHIYLGPYAVNIKCYRLGRNKIGSVFPIAES